MFGFGFAAPAPELPPAGHQSAPSSAHDSPAPRTNRTRQVCPAHPQVCPTHFQTRSTRFSSPLKRRSCPEARPSTGTFQAPRRGARGGTQSPPGSWSPLLLVDQFRHQLTSMQGSRASGEASARPRPPSPPFDQYDSEKSFDRSARPTRSGRRRGPWRFDHLYWSNL